MSLVPTYSRKGLLYRWIIFNAFMIALLGALTLQGWVIPGFVADITYISHAIAAVFFGGLAMSYVKVRQIVQRFGRVPALIDRHVKRVAERGEGARDDIREGMRTRYTADISIIPMISNVLVTMGLIGTFVGIMIAYGNVDPEVIRNLDTASSALSVMLTGMGVAFFTTVAGAVGAVWLQINHFFMTQALSYLWSDILEGEH